jgi:type I restriction enzyme, R subunit
LERLLKDEIKSRFATNIVQSRKFSELLLDSLAKYRNRATETVQVIEELIAMAKQFKEAARRDVEVNLNEAELAFYDALETNEASVRELGDEILKKIAVELAENLRKNVSVDWSVRETVRAKPPISLTLRLARSSYPPIRNLSGTDE